MEEAKEKKKKKKEKRRVTAAAARRNLAGLHRRGMQSRRKIETHRVRDTSRLPTAGSANWFLAFRYMAKRYVWKGDGKRQIEGGGFATLPYCDIVYTIVQLRVRERETRRKRHATWMHPWAAAAGGRVRTLKGLREWARRWQG